MGGVAGRLCAVGSHCRSSYQHAPGWQYCRSYNVAWTSFVLVVTFLVLVDPGIFGAAVIGTGSDIADALIRLAYCKFGKSSRLL